MCERVPTCWFVVCACLENLGLNSGTWCCWVTSNNLWGLGACRLATHFPHNFVDTHYVDTHYVDTHYVDTHYVDTHYVDTHYVDTHYVDTHYVDTHYVITRFPCLTSQYLHNHCNYCWACTVGSHTRTTHSHTNAHTQTHTHIYSHTHTHTHTLPDTAHMHTAYTYILTYKHILTHTRSPWMR